MAVVWRCSKSFKFIQGQYRQGKSLTRNVIDNIV